MKLVLIASVVAVLFGCAEFGNGAADMARIDRAIQQQDALATERQTFTQSIVEFEKTSGSGCRDYMFGGFDGDPPAAPGGLKRVKASALSTCGATYYWMTVEEKDGTAGVVKIEKRAPRAGDKIWEKLPSGKWSIKILN